MTFTASVTSTAVKAATTTTSSDNIIEIPHHLLQQPWGTQLLDLARLLSPRTWFGLAMNARRSPFVEIDWTPFRQGLMGVLLPLIFIWITHQTSLKLLPHATLATPLAKAPALPALYFLSPWICHCLWASMMKPLWELATVGQNTWKARSDTLPDALETLTQAVAQKRCIRQRRYDLYLPPQTQQSSNNDNNKAILFLPGAGISHVSYAGVAVRLSNAGFIVVVPSMEPLRLALPHLGANWWDMGRIIKRVERRHKKMHNAKLQWYLAGHSMGSFAAMNLLAQHFQKQQQQQQQQLSTASSPSSEFFCLEPKLVMWGSMYLPTYAFDLSSFDTEIELLLIQAQIDPLLDMTVQWKEALEAQLPPKCRTIVIPGGTHQGFASYLTITLPDSDLPHTQQQQLAVEETLQFLLGETSETAIRWNS